MERRKNKARGKFAEKGEGGEGSGDEGMQRRKERVDMRGGIEEKEKRETGKNRKEDEKAERRRKREEIRNWTKGDGRREKEWQRGK